MMQDSDRTFDPNGTDGPFAAVLDIVPTRLHVEQILALAHKERIVMFLFFSNKLGCLGSIAVSIVITLVVLLLLGVF